MWQQYFSMDSDRKLSGGNEHVQVSYAKKRQWTAAMLTGSMRISANGILQEYKTLVLEDIQVTDRMERQFNGWN